MREKIDFFFFSEIRPPQSTLIYLSNGRVGPLILFLCMSPVHVHEDLSARLEPIN